MGGGAPALQAHAHSRNSPWGAHALTGCMWSVPRQVWAARGEHQHDHQHSAPLYTLWASRTRRSSCSRGASGAHHAKFGQREVNISTITSAVGRSTLVHTVGKSYAMAPKPGLNPEPSPAQPEPSTRARLEVFVSPSPTKPSPSWGF